MSDQSGTAAQVAEVAIVALEPLVIAWAKKLMSKGQDPKAELDLMLDTADATVDVAEAAKFGP